MEQQKLDTSEISMHGAEKAAALLLAMGKDSALKLADFFSKEEIKKISDAASRLDALNVSSMENLVREFGKEYVGHGMLSDTSDLTEILGSLAASQETDEAGSDLDELDDADKIQVFPDYDQIKEFIEDEPTLIGAFFLGTLEDELAAKILTDLEPEHRKRLFKAYLDRKILPAKIQVEFQRQIVDMIFNQNQEEGNTETIEGAARIINYFSESASDEMVQFVEDQSPEVAAIIKKSLFKFSAIVDLPKPARSVLFDQVESDDLVKALVLAEDALRECVLETLSQRNRRMVESELGRIKPEQEEVEACQRKIAGIALALSKEGKISLSNSEDEA